LCPYLVGPGCRVWSIKSGCRTQHCGSPLLTSEHPYFLQKRDLMAKRSPHSRSPRRPPARRLYLPESAAHLCTRGPSLHGCCQAAGQRGHGKELCHPAGPTSSSVHARSLLYCAGMEGLFRSGRSGLTIRGSSKGHVVTAASFPLKTWSLSQGTVQLWCRSLDLTRDTPLLLQAVSTCSKAACSGTQHLPMVNVHVAGRLLTFSPGTVLLRGLTVAALRQKGRSMQDRGSFSLQAWSMTS